MILQNRGASFKHQAEFSFVNWPFSLKLLWAPLVDSLYFQKFGRRKTWMVPVNFLAATQDIAVDGWALTMLQRKNVSYASTCNSVGQTAGYFLGYVVFIALESATFCNNYLRSEPETYGIVTLTGFLHFWGIIYIVVTTLVAIFKKEKNESSLRESALDAASNSYKQLFNILKLPSIQEFTIILLTVKIGFAACDAVTSLKLIESGVPKEKLAILAVPLVPLQIILPLVISAHHTKERPMDLYVKAIPYRLMFGICAAFFVHITPLFLVDNKIPTNYYILLLVILALHQVTICCMFVQSMTFFAQISDPRVGGTYMTLLNTLSNLGGTWTSTVALWLVDPLTWKSCSASASNDCSTLQMMQVCESEGGRCHTWLDGYYLETILCCAFGLLWYRWGKKAIHNLQTKPHEVWKVAGIN
ncbi:hypothetical protein AAG570_009564 [Ranatra chinensis]|uniref:Acetyl-coenzyme A transporter 1 n=1 Tax=Ranatra chinensis TaxID=642074 RepID=A0ABD0YPF3_9HEMI